MKECSRCVLLEEALDDATNLLAGVPLLLKVSDEAREPILARIEEFIDNVYEFLNDV